eukprot:TRINITY_DN704_c0_g1_i1.p1 TRINITY_DN704_c0_g1~~TRINITY_DN704_c0_g1_i1.p1  ORF type:complete len:450 (-),score=19.99 TRINITY_DN704_c0_g1_i1:288-1637(-)
MATIKTSCTIKPAEPTPNHRLWVSDVDLIMPSTHSSTVYFYRPIDTHASAIETMKKALSQALVQFYPLAGRLRPADDCDGRLELECNGEGAVFYEAESDGEVKDYSDFKPTPELGKLVPTVDYDTYVGDWPLLLVQYTVFKCGGACLGLAVNHTISDGVASLDFVSTWAKIARGELSNGVAVADKPFLDRTVLKGREPPTVTFKHEEFDDPPDLMGSTPEKERAKESTVAMLKLTKDQVLTLKHAANEGRTAADGPAYSRFEAVSAHVWRCACKARELNEEQETCLRMAVDARTRLIPPLPNRFFGNSVFTGTTIVRSGEVVSNPLSFTTGKVRGAVQMNTDAYLRSALDFLKSQEDLSTLRVGSHTVGCGRVTYYGCPNFGITSWLSLPIFDADFGWGAPYHMGPTGLGTDGKAYLLPTPQGDGSLVMALRLHVEHMEAFKQFFYQGL